MTRSFAFVAACVVAMGGMAAIPRPAAAQAYISGAQLARACTSHERADENACNGYIAGALDAAVSDPGMKAAMCPPANVKLSALREAVGKFAKQRSEATRSSGLALLQATLKAEYPCTR